MRFSVSAFICVFIAMAASCGAGIDLSIRPDRSATIALSVEVPGALDAKVRQFTGGASGSAPGQSVPLFDAKAIGASARGRGLVVKESSSPSTRSYRGVFTSSDLAALLAGDARLSEAIRYERGAGWASLRVHVDKGNAAAVADLFPGLDPDLIESLQPPALYDNPVTVEEYRSMLAGLLGRTAAASLDDLSLALTVSLPGAVIESSGTAAVRAGKQPGASVAIRALDAMVLSVPIDFYLKWAE